MKFAMLLMLTALPCAAAHIAVIAHRGEHRAHPENTLPAIQAAIDAGADFVELDVRTTSDGRLVLMHDGKVDRTTNVAGLVREMTFDQIRALDAGSRFSPQFAGTKVPSFDEALALAHGKIGVYVDSKDIAPAELVGALARTDMLDRVVIYGGAGFLKKVQALKPALKIMPEAYSAATLERLLADLGRRAWWPSTRAISRTMPLCWPNMPVRLSMWTGSGPRTTLPPGRMPLTGAPRAFRQTDPPNWSSIYEHINRKGTPWGTVLRLPQMAEGVRQRPWSPTRAAEGPPPFPPNRSVLPEVYS